jgi:hypothetical protein
METQSDKDKVIRTIYYDSDSGFGSIAQTYKDAKNVLNTITYENVKEFMEKQRIQQLKGYKGFNSYVAKEPLQEIQIDLAVFTDSAPDNNGYKYAFVAVDIFTKFCHAVPIKDKQPNESLRAMKEVLNVIGKPKTLYHDFEGSWNSKQFITLLNENGVRQIITSSPPPFAERMIQTIKNMIHTRLEGLEMEKEKWINLLPAILKKYNNTEHSTTGVKPIVAKQGKDNIQVWLNISNKATFARTYPKLFVDDLVRVYIKKKSFSKGYEARFSDSLYKVLRISEDGKQFLINNNTRKLYGRHELKKVDKVETKDS